MPIFYFHIIADNTFLDDEGSDFAHAEAALAHARELAAELVKSGSATRGVIVVESEQDGGMFEVPLRNWHS